MGLDRLLDWAIDRVKSLLAKAVMVIPFVKNFLKGKVIAPIVNGLYDKLVVALRSKLAGLVGDLRPHQP